MFERLLLTALLALPLCGCLPTAIPLSKQNEATPDGLVGKWTGKNASYAVTLEGGHYAIQGERLKKDDDSPIGPYDMLVTKLGDSYYATVYFDIDKASKSWSQEMRKQLQCHVLPTCWTFKMELKGDSLKLLVFKGKENCKTLPDGFEEEYGFLSCKPSDVRAWLEKGGANKAFQEDAESFCFERQKAETKAEAQPAPEAKAK